VLEPSNLMQQHDFDALIKKEQQRVNMLVKEEVVPRYIFVSPFYYR
jgi:hypothetical protein